MMIINYRSMYLKDHPLKKKATLRGSEQSLESMNFRCLSKTQSLKIIQKLIHHFRAKFGKYCTMDSDIQIEVTIVTNK